MNLGLVAAIQGHNMIDDNFAVWPRNSDRPGSLVIFALKSAAACKCSFSQMD